MILCMARRLVVPTHGYDVKPSLQAIDTHCERLTRTKADNVWFRIPIESKCVTFTTMKPSCNGQFMPLMDCRTRVAHVIPLFGIVAF
jgi:hypothetical protein